MTDPLKLHAFADDQLSQDEKTSIEADLAECAESRSELDCIKNLKALVSEHHETHECRNVWSDCVARLNEIDKTRRVEGFVAKYAWGICGAFAACIVIAGVAQRQVGSRLSSNDLARVAAGLAQVRSSASPADPRISAELGRMLDVAKLSIAPGRMRVLRADRGLIGGQIATRLIVRDAIGDMGLIVLPGIASFDGTSPLRDDPEFSVGHLGASNCLTWHENGRSVVLIGERNAQDLRDVASHINVQ